MQVMRGADWNDLRHFLAIKRAGSLAGAARTLAVDQTTVGRRLAALEAALDARLFDRTPDGLALTAAGEAILSSAERVEETVLELERKIAGEDLRLQGTVRIAASEAFATRVLLPALPLLRAKHTDILLEIVTTGAVIDLARREAEIAIRLRPRGVAPAQPDLIARKLGEIAFFLYAAPAYLAKHKRPRGADLRGHDLIGYDEDLPPIPGAVWLRDPARGGRITIRCQSIPAMAAAAAAGAGLALLPCFFGDVDPGLARVSGTVLDWAEIWLVAHPDLLRTARVRAVMDALTALMIANRARLRGDLD